MAAQLVFYENAFAPRVLLVFQISLPSLFELASQIGFLAHQPLSATLYQRVKVLPFLLQFAMKKQRINTMQQFHDDILDEFRDDFDNPITVKMGEYLLGLVLKRATRMYENSPEHLEELMRRWLWDTSSGEPLRDLAIYVIKKLRLKTLSGELLELKKKANLKKYDMASLDEAIAALNTNE